MNPSAAIADLIDLHAGHHQPWHHDHGAFAVTLLLQAPETGGDCGPRMAGGPEARRTQQSL